MKLSSREANNKNSIENRHTYFTLSNQLKCLALLSSIKPLILWCTVSSTLSIFGVLFLYFKLKHGLITTISVSIFSNIVCQFVFLSLLFSRVMSITIEHYLTASFTLFNDLILIIPRYVLWELIFTSRWIWLSLHFFSATYSIFKLWNICTLFLLELPVFSSTFFFVAVGLSFIRFFGKNQNIFLISSKISVKPVMVKFNSKEHNNILLQFFEFTNYFIFNGGSGCIKDSFIFTILTLLLTIPIYYFGTNIPGISNLFNLINKFYSFGAKIKVGNEIGPFIVIIYACSASLFVVSFYWYCIELQSSNFRNLSSIDINGVFFRQNKLLNDNFNNIIPSDNFIRFVTNIQKKFVFFGYKLKIQQVLTKVIRSLHSMFAMFTILPMLFFFTLHKVKDLMNNLIKVIPINSNDIFEEWLVYEYRLFFILDKLQRQLDGIFSAVLLVDSSIQTRITTINDEDFRLVVQPTIGLDKRISFSQINIDDWFLNIYLLDNKSEKKIHFPKSINEWWYSNILFSDSLNNPKIKSKNKNISTGLDISNPVMYHRSEIFCILLEKLKNYCRKTDRCIINSENDFLDSKESGMIPQLIFLMQEMVLYTIDICCLYIYCYHRFVAKNLIINGSKSEWSAKTLNQYINLSVEVKNRIYFALEVGLLNSPYIHPIFEREIIRLYRGIEDSLELLLSLV